MEHLAWTFHAHSIEVSTRTRSAIAHRMPSFVKLLGAEYRKKIEIFQVDLSPNDGMAAKASTTSHGNIV